VKQSGALVTLFHEAERKTWE